MQNHCTKKPQKYEQVIKYLLKFAAMNTEDLVSLSWENKRRLRSAIRYGYLDNYEDNPRAWKHSLVGSLLWKNPRRCTTINRLKEIVGHTPEWEDLTDDVLRDFVEETCDAITTSSARTVCAELKAVINQNKRKVPSCDYAEILSVKTEASQAVYLTRDEISRIMEYNAIGWIEAAVKRDFLIGCLTGARICDAQRLTTHNCDIDTGMLSYVPQKTPGIIVTVPVDERMNLRSILAVNAPRNPTLAVFNKALREICEACNIDTLCTVRRRGKSETGWKWQFVSSHTARRSFATNLYLAGVSLEDVAMLMGHGTNIETTKRYICAERKISSNVLAYFQEPVSEAQDDAML